MRCLILASLCIALPCLAAPSVVLDEATVHRVASLVHDAEAAHARLDTSAHPVALLGAAMVPGLASVTVLAAGDVLEADVPAPSLAQQALAWLLDAALAAIVGVLALLAQYLRSKSATSLAARAGLVATEAATAAVHELDATMRPLLLSAAADGKLSPEEAKQLRDHALEVLKTKLGPNALKAITSAFGFDFLDTFLRGKVEQAVAQKKAVAAATVVNTTSAAAVLR